MAEWAGGATKGGGGDFEASNVVVIHEPDNRGILVAGWMELRGVSRGWPAGGRVNEVIH